MGRGSFASASGPHLHQDALVCRTDSAMNGRDQGLGAKTCAQPEDHPRKSSRNVQHLAGAPSTVEREKGDWVAERDPGTIGRSAEVHEIYRTQYGCMLHGRIEDALAGSALSAASGQVDLLITSPPFPLVRKKKYGNETGERYLEWLRALGPKLASLIKPDGSIVIEIGNAWEPGDPTMSTLPLEALLEFKRAAGLHLCQYLICHNPARLPTPAAWVTIDRVRLKDSFTHVWWLSRSKRPKADNRKVLTPYRKDMQRLLMSKKYNAGKRPSGHVISQTGFLTNHGGAISPSMLDISDHDTLPNSVLSIANTSWDSNYREYCRHNGIDPHPARMQPELVGFFVEFLTDPGDLVMDPFAGSNTTGAVAERLGRRWLGVEASLSYVQGSRGRFEQEFRDEGQLNGDRAD
jgi:DNA modification methylase